jgi:hypothetical protein
MQVDKEILVETMKKSLAIIMMIMLVYQQGFSAVAALPQDNGWPRQFVSTNATLLYYQPQIDSWKDYKDLSGRAAFSISPKSEKTTVGVVSFHAVTETDKNNRTVYLHDIQYTSVRFPSLDTQAASKMEQVYRSLAPRETVPLALDRLMADLDQSEAAVPVIAVKNDPPVIFDSASPAILLSVQGEPVLADVPKTDLQFVVNTTWDVFCEKSKKQYYLLANNTWLSATSLKGQYRQAT